MGSSPRVTSQQRSWRRWRLSPCSWFSRYSTQKRPRSNAPASRSCPLGRTGGMERPSTASCPVGILLRRSSWRLQLSRRRPRSRHKSGGRPDQVTPRQTHWPTGTSAVSTQSSVASSSRRTWIGCFRIRQATERVVVDGQEIMTSWQRLKNCKHEEAKMSTTGQFWSTASSVSKREGTKKKSNWRRQPGWRVQEKTRCCGWEFKKFSEGLRKMENPGRRCLASVRGTHEM